MSFAGFNSSKFVKGRLQAALYTMRKKNRQRQGAGGEPVEPQPVFTFLNSNAVLSENNTRLTTVESDVVGSGLHEHPVEGMVYAEARLFRGTEYALGMCLFGNDPETLSNSLHPGVMFEGNGLSVQMVSGWAMHLYANGGSVGPVADLSGSDNQSVVAGMAVRSATREVWVTCEGASGWVGGGDPVAGTDPSFVLGGTEGLRFGGNSSSPTSYVEFLQPGDFVLPVPDGFASYGG